jgi:predicted transcriptional regulator
MVEDRAASPELVRDLMTVGVATCSPDTSVGDIARLFLEKELEAIVVLDVEEGHALGVVSRDELVQAFTRPDARLLKAEEVMSEGVPQAPPDIPLIAAAQLMRDKGVRVLFLMHHAGGVMYPAAMISYQHILRYLAARNQDELRDLGIDAQRQSPLKVFIASRDAARNRNRSN